ncbi:hypothetical protein B7P43_G18095 [Cryptotermes secundus]|uniref:C2H2-type domain-containing protein n=1 Tax=Cryptotermes secundus TaxID=105785 RepID=A0A2J7QVJ3_9NEOP|nr:hypothetical protein B7P43_G18095 [Cryptotermes secundus]
MFSKSSVHHTLSAATISSLEYHHIYCTFLFQDNTEAVLLVDLSTSQLDRALTEDCSPYANTKEVEVLKGYMNGRETAKAVSNSTVVKIEKEMNKELQHQNYSVDDPLIKNEMEKNISQEHSLHQNDAYVNVKCEVKDEIKIEEHEIFVEDVQDVSFLCDDNSGDSELASVFIHNYNHVDSGMKKNHDQIMKISSSFLDSPQINRADDTGDHVSQTTDTTQIKEKADDDLSIKEQDIRKLYIKRIKDEVMQCATAEPKNLEESSLVIKNGTTNSGLTAAPTKYSTQTHSYSEVVKNSSQLVNLPLPRSKEKHLRSDDACTSSVSQHSFFLCRAEQVYTCNLCSQSFFNASTLKLHYEIHLRERYQKCNICGKVFHDSHKLKKHVKIHTESKLYASGNIYKFHNDNNNGAFDSPHNQKIQNRFPAGHCSYRCKLCNKSFANADILRMHVTTHTGNRLHRCVLCSKTFVDEYQFTQHLHLHCEEKTHVCRLCNKCFSNINDFRTHTRIHKQERTYLARKILFRPVSSLCKYHHKRTPIDIYEICNRAFTSSKNLKINKQGHIQEKDTGGKRSTLPHRATANSNCK